MTKPAKTKDDRSHFRISPELKVQYLAALENDENDLTMSQHLTRCIKEYVKQQQAQAKKKAGAPKE